MHTPVPVQQKAMPVIGFLGGASPGSHAPFVAAFLQGLSETGHVEGQNLAIEYRWAEGSYDRLPAMAADLAGRKVNVIVAQSEPAALAAKNVISTIPIVFIAGVEDGLVPHAGRLDSPSDLEEERRLQDLQAVKNFLERARGSRRSRNHV
jgi:putative ABC transport system substrate-binding protein